MIINKNKKIKVLIVDDSALIRHSLTSIISEQDNMEVIATADDPYDAVKKLKSKKPDVITLDIQMPRMDGITFLRKLMSQHPIPVIVVSSIAQKESEAAQLSYQCGAINVIEKPVLTSKILLNEWKTKFLNTIVAASISKPVKLHLLKSKAISHKKATRHTDTKNQTSDRFILIGSSAGGTEVINEILSHLNIDTAPIIIAQHMPGTFTTEYAKRLNKASLLNVREAVTGDSLLKGVALIAPGDNHIELKMKDTKVSVQLNANAPINYNRPSVDALFKSAVNITGKKKLAIILSGMGNDGAQGMLELSQSGVTTIAQSPESCIVNGMPKEAVKIGAIRFSLPVNEIVSMINSFSDK